MSNPRSFLQIFVTVLLAFALDPNLPVWLGTNEGKARLFACSQRV